MATDDGHRGTLSIECSRNFCPNTAATARYQRMTPLERVCDQVLLRLTCSLLSVAWNGPEDFIRRRDCSYLSRAELIIQKLRSPHHWQYSGARYLMFRIFRETSNASASALGKWPAVPEVLAPARIWT